MPFVTPAQAEVQGAAGVDSGLRRNDGPECPLPSMELGALTSLATNDSNITGFTVQEF